jgi:hypothetical protein
MRVTNIVSGRQIDYYRSLQNEQFNFYFGIKNDYFVYTYADADGELRNTRFPRALNAAEWGIDVNTRTHSSAVFELRGQQVLRGRYFRSEYVSERRILGLPHVTLTDAEKVNFVVRESELNVYVSLLIGGELHTTDLVVPRHLTTSVKFYDANGEVHVLRLQDNEYGHIMSAIREGQTEYTTGRDLNSDTSIFANADIQEQFGSLPELGRYQGTTRSTEIFNDSAVNWFVGFEVEKEDLEARNRARRAHSNLGNGWLAEGDCSLDRETGVEFVSPVYNLFDTKKMFEQFDEYSWVMNAEYSRRCGGHITISRRGMEAEEIIDKLAPFAPMLFSLYEGRLSTQYGGVQTKNEMKGGSRKAIFNCKRHHRPKNAVEIRIFSAVSTLESIKFRTKLVQWICAHIDKGTFTTFTQVADAMFNDKKLNKLLRSQYSAEKLARKQALTYVFGGCLEGQSPTEFLETNENYDRTIERMKRAYDSVQGYVRREVESKFGTYSVNKAAGKL